MPPIVGANSTKVQSCPSYGPRSTPLSPLALVLTGFLERNFRAKERERQEQHAANLRRESAHDEARSIYLPMAQSLALWATKQAYDVHWENVGAFVFPGTTRTVLTHRREVLDVVRDLMYGH